MSLLAASPLRPTAGRALELLDKLTAHAPADWRRHADDLTLCARLLQREGLSAAAERASCLAQAARAAVTAEDRAKPLRIEAPLQRFCVACGAPMKGRRPQARACSTTCRSRAFRGIWVSYVEAAAASIGLSVNDLWRTPRWLVEALCAEFGPAALDAAATALDAVAPRFISPDANALRAPWRRFLDRPGWVWLNPPYSRAGGGLYAWLRRARKQARRCKRLVVVIAPPGVGSAYRAWAMKQASEIRDLPKRLDFIHPETGRPVKGNPLGSSLFIFDGRPGARRGPARVSSWPC